MPERSKGADCKSAGYAFGGSNPPPGTNLGFIPGSTTTYASLAQLVERIHGKDEVSGSNPEGGSGFREEARQTSSVTTLNQCSRRTRGGVAQLVRALDS